MSSANTSPTVAPSAATDDAPSACGTQQGGETDFDGHPAILQVQVTSPTVLLGIQDRDLRVPGAHIDHHRSPRHMNPSTIVMPARSAPAPADRRRPVPRAPKAASRGRVLARRALASSPGRSPPPPAPRPSATTTSDVAGRSPRRRSGAGRRNRRPAPRSRWAPWARPLRDLPTPEPTGKRRGNSSNSTTGVRRRSQ